MTTERAIIIRNALGNAILEAKINEYKNTKDLTVLEYWLHCYYINSSAVFVRLSTAAEIGKTTAENICDIYNYIAENK